MSTLLGPDQVKKLNGLFPALTQHLYDLLSKDHTALGLMRVHLMVESFDSDEMARIFRELTFISPREKVALVRAAIYHLMAQFPLLFVATHPDMVIAAPAAPKAPSAPEEIKFTPGFKLNVNRSEAFHGQKPADTPPPAPVVTSTHTSKAAEMIRAGDQEQTAQQAKIDAAVAKLRVAAEPEIVDPVAEIETDTDAE